MFGFMMGLHWKGFIIEHAFFQSVGKSLEEGGGGVVRLKK